MKSKEEMIEVMIMAFENAIESACDEVDECYDMMQGHLTEIGMKAALKALCKALPDTIRTHEYYNQLKQWGKK